MYLPYIYVYCRNFLNTITHVDRGIREIEKVIRDYYGDDGKTTFLMTSDHGMTDWGKVTLYYFLGFCSIRAPDGILLLSLRHPSVCLLLQGYISAAVSGSLSKLGNSHYAWSAWFDRRCMHAWFIYIWVFTFIVLGMGRPLLSASERSIC